MKEKAATAYKEQEVLLSKPENTWQLLEKEGKDLHNKFTRAGNITKEYLEAIEKKQFQLSYKKKIWQGLQSDPNKKGITKAELDKLAEKMDGGPPGTTSTTFTSEYSTE